LQNIKDIKNYSGYFYRTTNRSLHVLVHTYGTLDLDLIFGRL